MRDKDFGVESWDLFHLGNRKGSDEFKAQVSKIVVGVAAAVLLFISL